MDDLAASLEKFRDWLLNAEAGAWLVLRDNPPKARPGALPILAGSLEATVLVAAVAMEGVLDAMEAVTMISKKSPKLILVSVGTFCRFPC